MTVLIVGLLGTQLHEQQTRAITGSPENEAKFQKFLSECKTELGISSDLKSSQWVECSKALKNADPAIKELVFQLNGVESGLDARLQAMKEGKCYIDKSGKNVCKGLD
jgi:hypothetical protein